MKQIAYWIAVFFGSGLSSFMPGTCGTLLSLLLWVPVLFWSSTFVHAIAIAFIFLLGLWASQLALLRFDSEDPSSIVVDEVVGMGISLLFAPKTWFAIVAAFLLFRVFDIWKPWPIRRVERRFGGAFGVMIDDVAAGLFALISLQALFYLIG